MTSESALPCHRCYALAKKGKLRFEMVQPVPAGIGEAPIGLDRKPCCRDCSAADGVTRMTKALDFEQARAATGNDRLEQYRLPGARMGLVLSGFMRPSAEGDMDRHHAWLDSVIPEWSTS